MPAITFRGIVAALVAVALLGLPVGPPAGAQEADDEAVREDLERADADLAAAQERLARAREQLDRAEQAEAAAAQALAAITAEVDAATARAATATEEARLLAEALAAQDRALDEERAGRDADRADLHRRVVWAWKHGPAADVAMRVAIGAGSARVHDLLLGQRMVDRVVEDATLDIAAADLRIAEAIVARSPGADLRDLARRAAFTARQEAAAADALRRRQALLVDNLASIRAEQEAVYAALQADRDALAALSLELRRALARIGVEGALVPPADLPLDGPPPPWVDLLPSAGRDWAAAVEATAVRNGLDGALFTALVWSESGFRPAVVSHAGAIGLAQLMPGTARGLGVDPYDPYQNLDGGSRYLRAQIEAFGRVDLGLAAYNAGPGRVRGAGNAVPNIAETQLYVVRVLERWELLRSAG